MRFLVIGSVLNVGRREHVIRAESADAAWARYERAYAKFACIHIGTQRMHDD